MTDEVDEWNDDEDLIDDLVESLEETDDAWHASSGAWLVKPLDTGGYAVYKAHEVRKDA